MEASVLGAGITAQRPDIAFDSIMPVAPSPLYNERSAPVTVTYRFYWYDAKGFEMYPLEAPRTIVIPTNVGMTVYASSRFLDARKVRLYLYL